jgi:hypothetical protein
MSELTDLKSDVTLNQETDTYSVVFRTHGRGQYALEMTRKVLGVAFIDGIAQISHKFVTSPSIQIFDSL